MDALPGLTAIDTRTGAVTPKLADPVIDPEVAVIVVLPGVTLVATPPLFTVAIAAADELHVTMLVSGCVVPLL
jgi:hypothetical protein